MDLVERLRRLSTCQVSDGMDNVGLPPVGLVGIHALEPAARMVGKAYTVVFSSEEDTGERRIDYLDAVQPGDVVVLANEGRLDRSVWGSHRSRSALARGVVGAVVDGAYRDVEEHRALGRPVFGRASTVARGGAVPVAVNEVVNVAGVTVVPGDYVIGDASGVVVVPQSRAADVVAAAEHVASEEAADSKEATSTPGHQAAS